MTADAPAARPRLGEVLDGPGYLDYVYSYPHKSAYRPFDQPRALTDAWRDEDRTHLFGYLHLPFCEMRCGFCNLFTATDIGGDRHQAYLDRLRRQTATQLEAIGPASFDHLAIGGGTPTLLKPALLADLFDLVRDEMGIDAARTPIAVETSPRTATDERLSILADRGVDRISIGIQSFVSEHLQALRRPETPAAMTDALQRIAAVGFPRWNVDLIYGIPGQTPTSLIDDIDRVLNFEGVNELFLYPLYIRAKTLLGRQGRQPGDRRMLYDHAVRHLTDLGWQQVSMRCFRAPNYPVREQPYRCQEDGMLGLGCGARSYVGRLHYSHRYAGSPTRISAIVDDYLTAPAEADLRIDHGIVLDDDDAMRRYVILSLLANELNDDACLQACGQTPLEAMPELIELIEWRLAEHADGHWQLTSDGLAASDVIGHWLFSDRVQGLMATYDLE